MIKFFHSLYLWLFRRKEWDFVSDKKVGIRKISERPNAPFHDLIEKTYIHKEYGYIQKPRYYYTQKKKPSEFKLMNDRLIEISKQLNVACSKRKQTIKRKLRYKGR